MRKILFACDLDNTLLHSYRKKKDGDTCVEWLKGQEQGYMDGYVYENLGKLMECVMFIPVTTRSVEQYGRIQWGNHSRPKYAVSTNGAILLDHDALDAAWMECSKAEAGKYRTEMENLLPELLSDGDYIRCRMVDEMYLFSYCREGVSVRDKVRQCASMTKLTVVASGKKIYFLPPHFNKGEALKRLVERFAPECVIAAGDSGIDVPMLEIADIAFAKEEIIGQVNHKEKHVFVDEKDLICKVFSTIQIHPVEEGVYHGYNRKTADRHGLF